MTCPGTGGDVSGPPFVKDHLPTVVEHRGDVGGKHVVVRIKTMCSCLFNINIGVMNNKKMAVRGYG